MSQLQAVESEEEAEPQQLEMFEGTVVQRYRLAPGSPGDFAAVDEDGEPMKLSHGDRVVVQVEYRTVDVHFKAHYKGGIMVKPTERIHVCEVVEGSQEIVGVSRRGEA